MAWTYNDTEVTKYITLLKSMKYSDNGTMKTGVDNYKIILTYAKTVIKKRKKERQLLLVNLSKQLSKCQYYIDKLETNFESNNLVNNSTVFQQNAQSISDISTDMTKVSGDVISIVIVDIARLKRYKRTQKELLAKLINVRSILKFYEDSEQILSELEGKLT